MVYTKQVMAHLEVEHSIDGAEIGIEQIAANIGSHSQDAPVKRGRRHGGRAVLWRRSSGKRR
jgi:hypothetical protein